MANPGTSVKQIDAAARIRLENLVRDVTGQATYAQEVETIELNLAEEEVQLTILGKPGKKITLARVFGHRLERATAYDFLYMHLAALEDDIYLMPGSDAGWFRTYEEQLAQWNSAPGNAANPLDTTGYHQLGKAVDIKTGISKDQYIANVGPSVTTPVWEWLKKNAERFGFDHDDGHRAGEAWHWTHLGDKIVGASSYLGTRLRPELGSLLGLAPNTRISFHQKLESALANAQTETVRAQLKQRDEYHKQALSGVTADLKRTLNRQQFASRALTAAELADLYDAAGTDYNFFNYKTGQWGSVRTDT